MEPVELLRLQVRQQQAVAGAVQDVGPQPPAAQDGLDDPLGGRARCGQCCSQGRAHVEGWLKGSSWSHATLGPRRRSDVVVNVYGPVSGLSERTNHSLLQLRRLNGRLQFSGGARQALPKGKEGPQGP